MKIKELITILRRFPRNAVVKVNNSTNFSINFSKTNENKLTLEVKTTETDSSCGTRCSSEKPQSVNE